MNEAIQRQLEERLNEIGLFPDEDMPDIARRLAEECAALRGLCAMVVESIVERDETRSWPVTCDFSEEEIAQLEAAAEGRPAT